MGDEIFTVGRQVEGGPDMTAFEGSPGLLALFAGVVVFCAVLWPAAVAPERRGATFLGVALFLGFLALTAGSGWTAGNLDGLPPRPLFVGLVSLTLAVVFAVSPWGHEVAMSRSVALLVGFQAFRLPLEIVLHQLYTRGELPVQMTWAGCNLDVVTGVTALIVAALAQTGRLSRGLLAAWNSMGMVLLFVIVVIAVGSIPTPLMFVDADPPNTFAVTLPGALILLPVASALVGHILVFRRLRHL